MALITVCAVECCGNPSRAKGFCKKHYERARRLGSPTAGSDKPRQVGRFRLYTCEVVGCDRQGLCRGMCNAHYHRWLRTGSAMPEMPIQANNTKKRCVGRDGYVSFSDKSHPCATANGRVLEHRAVMYELLGRDLLDGETVHHKNGNRGDNRPENLELWVSTQPSGQRPRDLVAWARTIIERYQDHPESA